MVMASFEVAQDIGPGHEDEVMGPGISFEPNSDLEADKQHRSLADRHCFTRKGLRVWVLVYSNKIVS